LFLGRSAVPENQRGVTYSRSLSGTGMPSLERFRARPFWGRASKRRPVFEIASFERDSSRSYATISCRIRLFDLLQLSVWAGEHSLLSISRGESTPVRGLMQEGNWQGNRMWVSYRRVEGVPPSNRGQDARDTIGPILTCNCPGNWQRSSPCIHGSIPSVGSVPLWWAICRALPPGGLSDSQDVGHGVEGGGVRN